jgi:hypothetical protein
MQSYRALIRIRPRGDAFVKEGIMDDVIYIGLGVGLLVICVGYGVLLRRA